MTLADCEAGDVIRVDAETCYRLEWRCLGGSGFFVRRFNPEAWTPISGLTWLPMTTPVTKRAKAGARPRKAA